MTPASRQALVALCPNPDALIHFTEHTGLATQDGCDQWLDLEKNAVYTWIPGIETGAWVRRSECDQAMILAEYRARMGRSTR